MLFFVQRKNLRVVTAIISISIPIENAKSITVMFLNMKQLIMLLTEKFFLGMV